LCEIVRLVPTDFPDLSRTGGHGNPTEGRRVFGRKPGKNLSQMPGKEVPQSAELAEFVGFKEFPIFSRIGVEHEAAVKMKGLLLPAGKAESLFRDEGPAARGTARFHIYRKQGLATAAKAVPSFFSIQKGLPAKGAAAGKEIFPDKGKGSRNWTHTYIRNENAPRFAEYDKSQGLYFGGSIGPKGQSEGETSHCQQVKLFATFVYGGTGGVTGVEPPLRG
jgi:hypothetical protein